MLVDRSTHLVVPNTDAGAGFEKGDGVYIGRLPEQFTQANTWIAWEDREWAMIRSALF